MIKRNLIYSILIIIASILLLGLNKLSDFQNENILSEDAESAENAGGNETTEAGIVAAGHEITLWENEGTFYAFLPSACKSEKDVQIPDGIDPSSIVWMHSENIPAVFIDTDSGTSEQINTDKDVKEPGHISVLDADGRISFDCPLTYIKGRGNTSFTEFEKKPYQIKLADSVPFLGMPSAKKWIFISNSADPSLLRNALSRNLAERLNLPQSEEGVFVDLYLNGEYMGNYYVTEKIEVGKNRLEITDLEKQRNLRIKPQTFPPMKRSGPTRPKPNRLQTNLTTLRAAI